MPRLLEQRGIGGHARALDEGAWRGRQIEQFILRSEMGANARRLEGAAHPLRDSDGVVIGCENPRAPFDATKRIDGRSTRLAQAGNDIRAFGDPRTPAPP